MTKDSVTAGDLVSKNGCPECDTHVIRITSPADPDEPDEFECAKGHTWTEYPE